MRISREGPPGGHQEGTGASREGGTKNKTPGGATIQLELGQHSRGDGGWCKELDLQTFPLQMATLFAMFEGRELS